MTKEKMQKGLDKFREASGVPGAAVGYMYKGNTTYVCSGFGNLVSKFPIDQNSIFEAASLSKQILAYVILRMVDEKILNLDQVALSLVSRNDFIGSAWYYLSRCEGFSEITVRNILSHSTGLPNWAPPDSIKKLLFQPGRCFQYSGMGYLLLQWLIEKYLLKPWQEIADKYIFSKLQMKMSGFIWNEAWENILVHGHSSKGEPIDKARFHLSGGSAAGLLSSVRDYTVFVQELLERIKDSTSAFSKMPCLQIDKFHGLDAAAGSWPIGWGLGIGVECHKNAKFVWQWGANPYFFNWFIANPETGEGIVIFTNAEPGHLLLQNYIEWVLGEKHPCFEFEKHYLKSHS